MMKYRVLGRSLGVLFVLLGIGCGGKQTPENSSAPAHLAGLQYPEWVTKGSGAYSESSKGKVFYGVGLVSGIRNVALARTTADNRARAEVAKVFEVYTASLMKDYAASTTAGDMSASSEEQNVEQAIKTFSATTLSGVEIVDPWFHPEDGSVYALASLNLESFKNNLDKMKDLNARVRDYVRQNADRAHADLDAEEEKHRELQ